MKKFLISLMLVVALMVNIVAMTACGGGNTLDKDKIKEEIAEAGWELPSYGFDINKEVTITFYHTMSATKLQPILDLYIEEFNQRYPNITVVHRQIGDYDALVDQIKKELSAGNQPNLAYCYPDHVALYNDSLSVVPLDSLKESEKTFTNGLGEVEKIGLDESVFVPAYYEEGKVYDNLKTLFTLPLAKSTEVLYYNRDFFEKHELKVPTTWDEMEALCEQIKKIDSNCIPLGYDSESNWFITMCEQLKSGYTQLDKNNPFIFDNAKNQAFVKRFAEWYAKGYVTTEALYKTYTSNLFTEKDPEKQRCYMVIGSSGGASYQEPPADGKGGYLFNTGIAAIPQVDPTNPKAISQGPSLCIFKDNAGSNIDKDEVVASWLFAKFLATTPEFQAAFSMTSGYAPVIQNIADTQPLYAQWLANGNSTNNIQATIVNFVVDQAEAHKDIYYVSPAFFGSSVSRKEVGNLMANSFARAMNGDKNGVDEEFKKAMKECNYIIGK